ncbi:MAG TPA: FAD-binding oxidoreductase, partial [Candidatus Eisenbacteria bacterium]|nr:FAD-binding oxidoreductase [Candidatus Eisenbacteria bacterium]
SWWIGTAALFPFVVVCGVLVVRKIQRSTLVWTFLATAVVGALGFGWVDGISLIRSVQSLFLDSAVVFFATIMLTEPLTTPPTKRMQIVYGLLTGFLFAPQIHVGQLYSTPELVLIVGNIFSYLVSPKQKLMLTLKEKKEVTDGIGEFIFSSSEKLSFTPGQYMEWTLQHKNTDSRGNRRYFTIASSPTEIFPQLGVRFYPNGSSFKNALRQMKIGDTIAAGQLAGEFTLPTNAKQKVVFFAGGIGITPFRSMIQYGIDTKTHRDIILFYANKRAEDIRYKDIFSSAKKFGVQTHYIVGEKITREMIQKEIPDFAERLFYVSGSQKSVKSFEDVLHQLNIPSSHIKKDFFPGLSS